MRLDALRARGEEFNEALARESYQAGAGLADTTDFDGLFKRYADLASDEALEAAQGPDATRELLEWVADNRVGRATAALDDRMHAFEAAATVSPESGETIPFQRVSVLIANEPRRERRIALDKARRAVLAEPVALRREKLALEAELLAPFANRENTGGVVEARENLSGIRLGELAQACDAFLSRTADLYRDELARRLKRVVGIAPGDAVRSDASWLFRGAEYDDLFAAAGLVATARRQVGEMGLDADANGRIRFDTEERERKRPRAFCAPVRVPQEVYLVIRPFGGYVDYRAFWHELGHALHFGNTDAALPFEYRWLGDNSVTECFAMLFEHMLTAPAWLRRYAKLSGGRLKDFASEQAFNLIAIVRRYAAKLRYELELHRLPSLDGAGPLYVELLTQATGFRYDPEDALLDLDDAFYSARYLRAWQFEALLSASLKERFDEDWFRNPRTGPVLVELFARGQKDPADVLARQALGRALDFGPLIAAAEATLS